MTLWKHELRLLLRGRLSVVALALLAVLSVAAVGAGMAEVPCILIGIVLMLTLDHLLNRDYRTLWNRIKNHFLARASS